MPYGRRIGNIPFRLGGSFNTAGARANQTLNGAYVNRTSGPAVAIRVRCETNEPINEVYVLNDETTGTRGSVSLRADVYDWSSATQFQPGTTLRASSNLAALPATDDSWVRFTFPTPYTPAAGEYVFIVVHNLATVPATDFARIMIDSNGDTNVTYHATAPFSTTNGFNTAGSARIEMPHVIVQGANTIYGNPIGNVAAMSTFIGRRGVLLSEDIKRFRAGFWRSATTSSNLARLQIFDLATPPSGTPLYDRALTATEALLGTVWMDFDLSTLAGSGPFVLCASVSSSLSYGGTCNIEDYISFPALFNSFSSDNFANTPVVTEVSGNWVIDRSRWGGMFMEVLDTLNAGSTPFAFMRGAVS